MSEYTDIFDGYIKEFLVRDQGSFMTVAPPIYFSGSHSSIAIRLEKNENGYEISDCHTVEDFWEDADIDIAKYKERIDKLCDSFDLYKDERCFCRQIIGTYSENPISVYNQIGYFLQAMILLGNIEIFD